MSKIGGGADGGSWLNDQRTRPKTTKARCPEGFGKDAKTSGEPYWVDPKVPKKTNKNVDSSWTVWSAQIITTMWVRLVVKN